MKYEGEIKGQYGCPENKKKSSNMEFPGNTGEMVILYTG
jgi:hypothetical protein